MQFGYVVELWDHRYNDWAWIGTADTPSEALRWIVFWKKLGWKGRYKREGPTPHQKDQGAEARGETHVGDAQVIRLFHDRP